MSLPQATTDYIEHGAPQGQRNDRLYAAAQQFFAHSHPIDDAIGRLAPRAIRDGLSAAEALRTIHSGYRSTRVKPPGALGTPGANGPLPDEFLALMDAAFEPGELVGISEARQNAAGEWKPGAATIYTRAEWERLHAITPIEAQKRTVGGCWFNINPLISAEASRTADNIALRRHVLAEFDEGSLLEQEAKLRKSGFPITALIFSGRRSLQALVRVDAATQAEWEERRDIVFKLLGCDPKNKDISRVARLAGCTREVDGQRVRQTLVATRIGPAHWQGPDTLPDIVSAEELIQAPPSTPAPIIKGLLFPACKLVLGASSKGRKSWTLLDLAISCALGISWLGMPVKPGKVLYINFELKPWMLHERLVAIANDRGLSLKELDRRLEFWNLRGHSAPFDKLIPRILERIATSPEPYLLIILDPMYKGLGELDENAAGDMNALMNELERLCEKTGAALVVAHHFAKGDPWEKEPMDRLSGSGVFGREPDALVVLTAGRLAKGDNDLRDGVVSKADKEEIVFCDTILRACPPIAQFILRWQRYHFKPTDMKTLTYRPTSRAGKYAGILTTMPRLLHAAEPLKSQVIVWVAENCGVSLAEADKIFETLRRGNYDIVTSEGSATWVGVEYAKKHP